MSQEYYDNLDNVGKNPKIFLPIEEVADSQLTPDQALIQKEEGLTDDWPENHNGRVDAEVTKPPREELLVETRKVDDTVVNEVNDDLGIKADQMRAEAKVKLAREKDMRGENMRYTDGGKVLPETHESNSKTKKPIRGKGIKDIENSQ